MEEPPIPTQKMTRINGYDCQEYIKINKEGGEEKYYVTESFPFINYGDFTFKLPGFIMKSSRNLLAMGK